MRFVYGFLHNDPSARPLTGFVKVSSLGALAACFPHSFEGVCVNYRHLGPRRVWIGGSKRRLWLISAGSGSSASSGSVFQGPQYLTTLPSNMLKNDAGWAPKSLPGASGGLWGRSGHRLLFLRRKKNPAGALKTRIGLFFGGEDLWER